MTTKKPSKLDHNNQVIRNWNRPIRQLIDEPNPNSDKLNLFYPKPAAQLKFVRDK